MVDILRETVVSLDDVARRLKVTVKTVRNWATREVGPRLETTKFGGKVVTSLEALHRFGVSNGRKKTPQSERGKPNPAVLRHLKEAHGL